MDLAIPIFQGDKIYNIVDILKPKTGTIATAYESMKKNNIFKALLDFIAGSVETIYSIDGESVNERGKIKLLCGLMPYQSAEAVALKVMAMINEDDAVEGVYPCPRCGKKIITDADDEYGLCVIEKISALEVICMNSGIYTNNIQITLNESVKIKNRQTDEILETIDDFELRYPTVNDCIMAGQNMRDGQEVRVQMKLYINAMTKVNGNEVDRKWKAIYGMPMFNNMDTLDQAKIGKAMLEYGLKKTVQRECPDCGKIWDSPINTSNFFASGLRP